jgi:hypothetical protein
MDAHNCYPYDGKFADRIERALKTGVPLAIEQDLAWHKDAATGKAWSVVSHETHTKGTEPTMKAYFFERIRPIVERALKQNRKRDWPLIVLNLDFKSNEPEHHQAVWELLGEYEAWLTTAKNAPGTQPPDLQPLDLKPVLVLTGDSDAQEKAFTQGAKLRLFGSTKSIDQPATNYRRWSNNPWARVEDGGQRKAGAWTPEDEAKLQDIVKRAHANGYWIRFYTLNGHTPEANQGWSPGYNFGSMDAAVERWKACIRAKVDFVATDQYEEFAALLRKK